VLSNRPLQAKKQDSDFGFPDGFVHCRIHPEEVFRCRAHEGFNPTFSPMVFVHKI
jgi:hypothetical protein